MVSTFGVTTARDAASASFFAWMNWLIGARVSFGVSVADVALNGTKHTLHDYSPEVDKYLTIHCYQPEPGYCACVLQANEP